MQNKRLVKAKQVKVGDWMRAEEWRLSQVSKVLIAPSGRVTICAGTAKPFSVDGDSPVIVTREE